MNKKLSDEQIDRIAGQLVKDFSLDAAALDEIAESPQLWWSVRKGVEAARTPEKKGWLATFGWLYPAFGVVALGVCFGAAIWLFSAGRGTQITSSNQPAQSITVNQSEIAETSVPAKPVDSKEIAAPAIESTERNRLPQRRLEKIAASRQTRIGDVAATSLRRANEKQERQVSPVAEQKTDFIALSYAGNSEGGQVVRVKVPSAMMVSLGVVSQVDKDSPTVNAEVVVGDDGLARAIRFIR